MEKNHKINVKISEYMKKKCHLNISPDDIWVDSKEFFEEFPKESLKKNCPLLLSHFSGSLIMVIPEFDYGKLCLGWFSIGSYVKTAKWGVGYHWSKNKDEFRNIQWKVLEKNDLVENPEKVKWFFKKFECIYKLNNLNWKPNSKNCEGCEAENCFLRDSKEKLEIAENINKKSPNSIFIREIKKRVYKMYGVEIFKIRSYAGKHVWIKPAKCDGQVKLLISRKILLSLMENDDRKFAKEKGREVKIQIRTPENIYFQNGDEMVLIDKGKVVPNEHAKKFLEIYWNKFKVDDQLSNLYAALEEL